MIKRKIKKQKTHGKRFSVKQKNFADRFLETGNGVQSILETYNTTDYKTAGVMACENLKKPIIIEYMNSKAMDAASVIVELSQHSDNDNVRLNASKDILDRSGFKPVEKTQNINMNIQSNFKISEIEKKLIDEYEKKLKKLFNAKS